MKSESAVKLFGLNNLSVETELQRLQKNLGFDLGKGKKTDKDETYYPQFSQKMRQEAASMAIHYEIFYCLEGAIRELITERLEEEAGPAWWESDKVPEVVRNNAQKNKNNEIKKGVRLRSANMIAYTTFGELGEIIKANWSVFADTFKSPQAVEEIMSRLNGLRAPIAHCCPLAEDEILRLRLTMKDWFHQME